MSEITGVWDDSDPQQSPADQAVADALARQEDERAGVIALFSDEFESMAIMNLVTRAMGPDVIEEIDALIEWLCESFDVDLDRPKISSPHSRVEDRLEEVFAECLDMVRRRGYIIPKKAMIGQGVIEEANINVVTEVSRG